MSFKRVLVAAAVAVAFFNSGAALAMPLGDVSGPVEFKLSGVTTSFFTQSDTTEKTWGVGNILQITTSSMNPVSLWNSGEGGDFLGYMLYGVADLSSSGVSPNLNLYNVGAVDGAAPGSGCGLLCGSIYIDMFKRTSNPNLTTPSARTGYNTYNGVSNGLNLWLRLQLTPGIVADDVNTVGPNEGTTATLSQTLNALTLPTAGSGTFYANVIDGSAMGSYNSNGFITLLGSSADMRGIFTLTDNTVGSGAGCSPTSTDCFFGLIRDPVSANAIPEPGSIALLGLGLLAMGCSGIGRRRMTQAQG